MTLRPAGAALADVVRRVVDITVAVVVLVLAGPVLVAIAAAVRVTMGAPVLFHQRRLGRHGRPFDLHKFRTMHPAEPGRDTPEHDHERISRLGAFLRATSLDELPGFVNLLRGDITLVGPRPLPVHYWDRFRDHEYRRFEVRPGITGLAQVAGRNSIDWDQRLALDAQYVDDRSLVGDLHILLRTVPLVLRRSGVDRSDGITMTALPEHRPGTALHRPRPNVLYLVTSDISSVLLRGQLAFLRDQGFDVSVGCAVDRTAGRSFDDGIVVHPLPYVREPSPLRDLRALFATVRLVRRLRPDCVNASTPKAGLLGMLAARLTRVPVRVHVVRGLRSETTSGPARAVLQTLERLTMHAAHHVVFNSASLLAEARRRSLVPGGRGIVLGHGSGNGVRLDRYSVLPDRAAARAEFGLGHDVTVVGFVGRLTVDKGVVDLDHVLHDALATRDDVRVLVVGDHEDGDAAPADVRSRLDTDHRVVRPGWLHDPLPAYAAMDLLLFPSHREGLPNAPLEAQACGVPVVGYAATGTVDAVVDGVTGLLVPVGDHGALAVAVVRLLDDADLRHRMGAAGRTFVSDHFADTEVWARLADAYREWLTQPS